MLYLAISLSDPGYYLKSFSKKLLIFKIEKFGQENICYECYVF